MTSGGGIYYLDPNGDINKRMKTLVSNQINDDVELKDDKDILDQKTFVAACSLADNGMLPNLSITWSKFASNTDCELFKLLSHPMIDTWIRLDVCIKLFANLRIFEIEGCTLSSQLFEDIWMMLSKFKDVKDTVLTEIDIRHPVMDDMTTETAVKQFRDKFKMIDWSIELIDEIFLDAGVLIWCEN